MNNFKIKKKNEEVSELDVKAWEKTVEVQMHFNELQMKIRNFSILLVSALVGAGGIALKEHIAVDHYVFGVHVNVSLSAILFLVAALSWLAFFFMDHFWYYPLLVGSIKHGQKIEKILADKMPSIGLTTTIGAASPQMLFGRTLHSKHKSVIFYTLVFVLLLLLTTLTAWAPVNAAGNKPTSTLAVTSTAAKISAPEDENQSKVPVQPANSGTTIIFNQELTNGDAPANSNLPKKASAKTKTNPGRCEP